MSGIGAHTRVSVLAAILLATGAGRLALSASPSDKPPACLTPAAWYIPTPRAPRPASTQQVVASMAEREIVLLGERHEQADHHRWQLQTLAALQVARPDMVIGFEAFPRRVQPALDRWIAGELGAAALLEAVDWSGIWSYRAELYLPLFHFARMNRLSMIALNVDRALTRSVAREGWNAVPAEQKEGVSQPAPPLPAYRDYLLQVFRQHASAAGADAGQAAFRYFMEAQLTWDRAMAEALARASKPGAAPAPLVVGIAGAGHVRFGHGIAHQLRDLGVERVGTLLPIEAEQACEALAPGLADAVSCCRVCRAMHRRPGQREGS